MVGNQQGGNPWTVEHSEMFLTTILTLSSERGTSSTRQDYGMLWLSWTRLPYPSLTAEYKGINHHTGTQIRYIQLATRLRKIEIYRREKNIFENG